MIRVNCQDKRSASVETCKLIGIVVVRQLMKPKVITFVERLPLHLGNKGL